MYAALFTFIITITIIIILFVVIVIIMTIILIIVIVIVIIDRLIANAIIDLLRRLLFRFRMTEMLPVCVITTGIISSSKAAMILMTMTTTTMTMTTKCVTIKSVTSMTNAYDN